MPRFSTYSLSGKPRALCQNPRMPGISAGPALPARYLSPGNLAAGHSQTLPALRRPLPLQPYRMRILIAEDDSILADGLSRSLRHHGYAVDAVGDGLSADSALAAQAFDLLILDLGLPQLTGLEVLRRLRARNSLLPVLILTAADSVEQRVKGLDLGADDYMAKPFALSELEARVRALTRRGAGGGATVIRHGRLVFDQTGRVASVDDHTLDLSAREVSLLEILLARSGRMVSKTQLVDHLCEWGEEVSTNAIEVYVHRLRKKLEPSGVKIITVRGLGYCLERDPGATACSLAN
ncbi:two-component system response regulator [Bordetella trematum]|uniref:Two-component system response regulator n=2 Tax=Bordetella trematum TaxID=123899 RepID=A0A157SUQ1_9BORD|nr:two-component system response regulator [Bordetella trematum]SAI40680.1 two-component system response regulator [Bordetella trematum]SAI74064.1 two-component system response regulator [Bordetella trematum]SPU53922.1 two-component system response regulator [Bordetella trematum]SUV97053.1 two-component system response regulator [Bordetella trematum]